MIVCMDVDYREEYVVTTCIGFQDWEDKESSLQKIVFSEPNAEEYEPGQFYKRELPPLLNAIQQLDCQPSILVVDGYVWLTPEKPGLGKYLYDAFHKKIAVVGIAKKSFLGTHAIPVLRANSTRPLYITSEGMDPHFVAEKIQKMQGNFRLPTLIKLADRIGRDAIK